MIDLASRTCSLFNSRKIAPINHLKSDTNTKWLEEVSDKNLLNSNISSSKKQSVYLKYVPFFFQMFAPFL